MRRIEVATPASEAETMVPCDLCGGLISAARRQALREKYPNIAPTQAPKDNA
jgi:hypothetical protein